MTTNDNITLYNDYFNGMPIKNGVPGSTNDYTCNKYKTARLFLGQRWIASAPIQGIKLSGTTTWKQVQARFGEKVARAIQEGKEMMENLENAGSSVLSLLSSIAGRNKEAIKNLAGKFGININDDQIEKFVDKTRGWASSISDDNKDGNYSKKYFDDIYECFHDGKIDEPISSITFTVYSSDNLHEILNINSINHDPSKPLKGYLRYLAITLLPYFETKESSKTIKGLGAFAQINAPIGFKRPLGQIQYPKNVWYEMPDNNGEAIRRVNWGVGLGGPGMCLNVGEGIIIRSLLPTNVEIQPAQITTDTGDLYAATVTISFQPSSIRTSGELVGYIEDY